MGPQTFLNTLSGFHEILSKLLIQDGQSMDANFFVHDAISKDSYRYLTHIFTFFLPGSFSLLHNHIVNLHARWSNENFDLLNFFHPIKAKALQYKFHSSNIIG